MKRGKLNLISLQETKAQAIDKNMVLDLWGRNPFNFVYKLAVGRSGGIMVAWNTNVLEVTNYKVGEFSVSILCKNKDDKEWAFSGVYGPCDQSEFGLFREDLCIARYLW